MGVLMGIPLKYFDLFVNFIFLAGEETQSTQRAQGSRGGSSVQPGRATENKLRKIKTGMLIMSGIV